MNAVVEHKPESTAVTAVTPTNPMQMLALAVQQGMGIETLRELMQLKREWEADEARKSFVAAISRFKANPPKIVKTKHVKFTTQKGTTEYVHATLADVCAAAIKGLAEVGIHHRWDVAQNESRIKVTCVLTHEAGHSESVSMHSAPDETGGKNSIQAIGSAVTYLQRYTLLAAIGLAAADQDDDGQKACMEFITDDQAAELKTKAEEVGADIKKFLRYLKVDSFAHLPASKYKVALQALEAKAKKAQRSEK